MPPIAFPPGVYAASLTWFSNREGQPLDLDIQTKHLRHLVESGIAGIVVAGSNGEAVALNTSERLSLVSLTRNVASELNREDLPIIMGTVGQMTQEIVEQLGAASQAGANFGLVLTPSYFHFAMDAEAITQFFTDVADRSAIPILIYSWPLVTSGIEINSDIMTTLGKHPNIAGAKLTCGGVAKAVRLASEFEQSEFCTLSGFTDWLLPGLSAGAAGSISGFANLCPRTCVRIYEAFKAGKLDEARALQNAIAKPEWDITKSGINGTKWAVAKLLGYDVEKAHPRRPYPEFSDPAAQKDLLQALEPIFEKEKA